MDARASAFNGMLWPTVDHVINHFQEQNLHNWMRQKRLRTDAFENEGDSEGAQNLRRSLETSASTEKLIEF